MNSPQTYTVTFESDYARIVQVNRDRDTPASAYEPAGLPLVRVILESDDPRTPRGSTRYCESAPDDSGDSMREVRVELKSRVNPAAMKFDAVRLDPTRYTIDFENDRVRVVRLAFGPHERGMMVEHPPRVLVTLTDVAVKLTFADGHTDERGAPAGIAGWLERETLQTENARDQPLQVVLIEPK